MCEGKFQASDNDEGFGERDENIRRTLNPYVDTPRWGVVDVMLQYTAVDHRDRDEEEPGKNSKHWAKVDLVLAKQWIKAH